MALLELKGFGVGLGATQVAGVDLTVEPGTMLAVVGRGDGAVGLLALAVAGLAPESATTSGTLGFAGKRVLYLDRNADASAVVAGPELIVADEPGRERDPATQLELLKALQQASRTAAVIIFTADFRLALSMGLEVAVVANGKLLVKASASQIFELPQYDTVRHLVGGARIRTRTLMRPPIGEPVLELDGVTKVYRRGLPRLGPPPVEALRGVGFAVRQGEVVGMLGPAGAGKSTLLRLIAGIETPSSGHIGRRQGLVGYVFSDPRQAFNPMLPVGVSLTEPLRVEQTLLVEEQADRLVEVVRAVGLEPELLTRLPGEFGIADLQRMALARALAGRPNLLLMDDPTAWLDPAELREFLVLFARVRADFGLTAIVASREFEVVRAVADRLLVLDAGRILEGGKPAELAEAPKQEITRRLVSVRYPGPVTFEPVVVAVPEPAEPTAAPEGVEQIAAESAAAEASNIAAAVAAVAVITAEPERAVEAEPTAPVHGLSAEIVIAPVVLPEPVAVVVPAAVVLPEPAEPLAAQADPTATSVEAAPKLQGGPAVEAPQKEAVPVPETVAGTIAVEMSAVPVLAPTEPVPTPAEPIPAPEAEPAPAPTPEPGTEAAPPLLELPAAIEVPAEVPSVAKPQDSPAPDAPPPEPRTAEPVPPLADGADEAAEGREAEGAVGGLVDTAGGADAPDGEASR